MCVNNNEEFKENEITKTVKEEYNGIGGSSDNIDGCVKEKRK